MIKMPLTYNGNDNAGYFIDSSETVRKQSNLLINSSILIE